MEWDPEREAGVGVKVMHGGCHLTFAECLLQARHGFKHSRCIISFHLVQQVSSCYRTRNCSSELHGGQFQCCTGIWLDMINVVLYFPFHYYYCYCYQLL